ARHHVSTITRSSSSITPHRELRSLAPSVFHHGNRVLNLELILREVDLFLATLEELGQPNPKLPNPYRAIKKAEDIHQKLRAKLLESFPWLDKPAPARIPPRERAG